MAGWLDGMVTLVTGGGSGLGRGVVERFVQEGARVGVLEYMPHKVEQLTKDFPPDVVRVVEGDVRNLRDHHRAVAETVNAFGRLDAFVSVAAIADFTRSMTAVAADKIDAAFDEVMHVNVKGQIFGAMATAPELAKTGGSMTYVLSTNAQYPGFAGGLYTVSKHAGVGVVRQLAFELAPTIRVNGVCPGGILDSDARGLTALGQRDVDPSKAFPQREEQVRSVLPLQIFPVATDYGGLFVLLASRESRIATGSIINWDQGLGLMGHGVMSGLKPEEG